MREWEDNPDTPRLQQIVLVGDYIKHSKMLLTEVPVEYGRHSS